jgi:hypothetical protein
MRTVVAVVVGYVVMFVAVFVSFSIAYLLMGTGGAFRPGTYDVSLLWVAASLVLGFLAAVAGGLVAVRIGRSVRAAHLLAGLVLVLGLLLAIPALLDGEAPPMERPATVDNFEAMQNAKQPDWMTLVNPILGAVGVLAGARLRRGSAP